MLKMVLEARLLRQNRCRSKHNSHPSKFCCISLRNAKGDSRVAMLMQGVASQTGPGTASTSPGNSNGQLQGETGGPPQAGQTGLGQSQVQSAKIVRRPQVGSLPSGWQGDQGGQANGLQSPSISSVAGQQKESQQVKQAAQVYSRLP